MQRIVLLPVTEMGGPDDPTPLMYNGDSLEVALDDSWDVTRAEPV